MMSRIVVLVAALAPALSSATDIPACAMDAAGEFRVPEKLFKSMVIQAGTDASSSIPARDNEFGPMKLGYVFTTRAAKSIGATPEAIRTDPCQNYRAAAWHLAEQGAVKFATEEAIWEAVGRYFYGRKKNNLYTTGIKTNEVKKIHDTHFPS